VRRALVWAGAVALATLTALGLPALAIHTNQNDPNDTDGRLDVRSVFFAHESGPPTWRFRTFANWSVHEIWDAGYLVLELDTRSDAAIDHFVVVRSDGKRLIATLYRVRNDGRQAVMGTVKTVKGGPRRAWVAVALRKLQIGPFRTSYFWAALTSFSGSACPRPCIDRIPDEGMVEQPLPGVTPSPTPTPTPSPTETPTPSPT
jgi:hypothetical protein